MELSDDEADAYTYQVLLWACYGFAFACVWACAGAGCPR
jgi:hypothetical protein